MEKQFIIGNWKSHKTVAQTEEWFADIALELHEIGQDTDKTIILCPPFPLLPLCKTLIGKNHLPIHLGSQDISPFGEGAYTGAVAGTLLRNFVEYCIIGHSERRKYFAETEEILAQKVIQAKAHGIEPLYCVPDKDARIPHGVNIVAFEPIASIGSGHPDTPEDAEAVARFIKEKNGVSYVIYGGSVTDKNVHEFTQQTNVNGVLPGGASLSSKDFAGIIHNA